MVVTDSNENLLRAMMLTGLKKKGYMLLNETECEAAIKANVKAILEKQGKEAGKGEWGVDEHLELIFKVAQDCGMDAEARGDFRAMLKQAGLGGNQSQFRQSKFLKGLIPEQAKRATLLSKYD